MISPQFAYLLVLFYLFGYLTRQFEKRPIRYSIPQPPKAKPQPVDPIDEDTKTFLAIMTDETQDDLRLKNYKPLKVRNRAPLAIAATPSTTADNMRSIQEWMSQHGTYEPPRDKLARTASNTRRSYR